jgi:glycine/D-amino acid oxidase-like deaminating enzyme
VSAQEAEPVTNDLKSRSFWLSLDPYTPNAPLDEDIQADFTIVGGGFTGLWTAYLLLKRYTGLRIVVLEKEAVGYGASGRSGGVVMPQLQGTLAQLVRCVGETEARKIYNAALTSVHHINDFITSESIECDLQPNGMITLSNTPPQDELIREHFETAQRLGVKEIEFLQRDTAQARIHSEQIRCAVREQACSLVDPARLVRGIKRVIENLGGRVYEGTPVNGWEETYDGVTLQCPAATVHSQRALLAANAFAATWNTTRRCLIPLYTYICLTEPLSESQWASVGWRGLEAAQDRRAFLHHFRPTKDGRILWGGRDAAFHTDGPRRTYDRAPSIFTRLRETFEWFFPQLKNLPFESCWGGPVGMTRDFLPQIGFFHEKKQRTAFAFGYNGRGLAISHLAAHAVVDLFAEKPSEWTDLPFVGRKLHGLGRPYLRNPLVRATMRAHLRADDAGRKTPSSRTLRFIGSLTGAGFKIT